MDLHCAGIFVEIISKRIQQSLPLILILHLQKVGNNGAAHLAQPYLAGNLFTGIHIDGQLATLVSAAIHINRCKRCRFLHDDDTALGQYGIGLE